MIRRIGRGGQWLFLVLAFAVRAAAQDQDLSITNYLGDPSTRVRVAGYPAMPVQYPDPTTLKTAPLAAKQVYLGLDDAAGDLIGPGCPLMAGWTVNVLLSGNMTIVVTVGMPGSSLVVTTAVPVGTTHPPFSGDIKDPAEWWSLGDMFPSLNSTFGVKDAGGAPQCAGLGTTSYLAETLHITTDDLSGITANDNRKDPGDVPIPIIGGSLKFFAPMPKPGIPTLFSCSNDGLSCRVDGPKASRIELTHPPSPRVEPYLDLLGSGDWRITVYPQQLEITPSFWGWGKTIRFTVPASGKFRLTTEGSGGRYFKVVNKDPKDPTDVRPQQFVIDWSPPGWFGWFENRRYLPLPCVQILTGSPTTSQCTLNFILH